MRIRPMNILWATAGDLLGSGKAQQFWKTAQRQIEERQQRASSPSPNGDRAAQPGSLGAEPTPSVSAFEAGFTGEPVERFTA
jgi:hypothetical protein